jgi:hypothetical protein
MSLLESSEEISCDARQPNAPDPTVIVRLLARGKSGTDEVIDESARRRARPADRSRYLTDRRFSAVGDVVHRDQLREGQLAPAKLVQGGEQELRLERGRIALSGHPQSLGC